MVIVIAACLGLATSVDNPARQSFVPQIVGTDLVANAVSLNSSMVNAARAAGPALAGVLIVSVGVAACFFINSVSFVAVIIALATMEPDLLHPAVASVHAPVQLLEGLRYVRRTPRLLTPLRMMALIGALSYEFQVVLPVLAKHTFHGNADAYGFFTAALGAAAVIGGLAVASRPAHRNAQSCRGGRRLRTHHARCRRGAHSRHRGARPGHGRRWERRFHVPGQHDPAADRRPEHARTRDGLVGRRLPGNDPDWWPGRGLRGPTRRPLAGD
jgi:hypothetical protein